MLRCRFKVAPLEQWSVRREFLRPQKRAFDARGIEIPFPHLTLYAGVGKDGTAPEFRVRAAPAAIHESLRRLVREEGSLGRVRSPHNGLGLGILETGGTTRRSSGHNTLSVGSKWLALRHQPLIVRSPGVGWSRLALR